MRMTEIEKAKKLFLESGLAFPTIPRELAAKLKKRGKWLFSTREIGVSPYILEHYVREIHQAQVEDYAVLSHSGHGVNSYALQYYLVFGALGMFLHLGWGGVYTDDGRAAAEIRDCFSLSDEIVPAMQTVQRLRSGDRLTIVGSDFYGSYWSLPGERRREWDADSKTPMEVLAEVHQWLISSR